jgi:uncharacterized membrane protein
VVIAILLLGLVPSAFGQDTGSSFGGGSFGGGGGGGSWGGGGGSSWGGGGSSSWGGGGGSSWSGSGSSYSGSSSGSSYSGSGGCAGMTPGFVTFLFIFLIVLVLLGKREDARRARWMRDMQSTSHTLGPSPAMLSSWQQMDVTVLMLGIDWRARRFVQSELDRLARTGDTKTPIGLSRLLRQSVATLQSVELAWLYAGAYNAQPMSAERAEQAFRAAATEARSRFKKELIRNADGTTSITAAGEQRARREEGEGVVVVTLVVAARRELLDIHDVKNAELLRRLLDQLAALQGQQLAAMEVIWSPSAENDRMSTAELEVLYRDMHRIDDETIAGRVFCDHCGGPYARELGKCSHCGAPPPPA